MISQHEMFLRGKPLTTELEELANQEKAAPAEVEPEPEDDILKPFTKRERKRLGKLQGSEDWGLVRKALDKRIEMARNRAILLSEQDPAGGMEAIQSAWIYIKAFKTIQQELDSIIDAAARGQDDEKGMGEQRRTA